MSEGSRPRSHAGPVRGMLAILIASGLATVTGCSSSSQAGPPVKSAASTTTRTPSGTGLSWRSCDGRFLCTRLRVPLSYARPSGGSLLLSVIMLPATGGQPSGDLVMNPGGPGVSGVSFLESAWQAFPPGLRRRF
ncbi:MAG TPA: hypothetical protein VK217_08800, partial [Acidimicrobiales bacterium]|nr:hypothetical protein [Acidimicrobiales bacterium]